MLPGRKNMQSSQKKRKVKRQIKVTTTASQ